MRVVKWVAGVVAVLLVCGGGVAWWQREPIRVWWVVRGLKQAGEGDREAWVKRVVGLGEPAIGPLVDGLADEDDRARANVLEALESLVRANDALPVADHLVKPFSKFSPATRGEVLSRLPGLMGDFGGLTAGAEILAEAAELGEPESVLPCMAVAEVMLVHGLKGVLPAVRTVARNALRSGSEEVKLKGIRLCLKPHVQLLEPIVGLLRDASPEVRRAAVLAVGPAEEVVREDLLLAGLHDADEEVRKLTETALRGRGLRPEHLELGRLLTHPTPTTRLLVLDRIRDMLNGGQGDLDPGAWLRRLSHDQSPAVRAAALRMMSQQGVIDLSDRVDQMARNDPSPTVTQLARYYQGLKR